jgi:hypothetical protein
MAGVGPGRGAAGNCLGLPYLCGRGPGGLAFGIARGLAALPVPAGPYNVDDLHVVLAGIGLPLVVQAGVDARGAASFGFVPPALPSRAPALEPRFAFLLHSPSPHPMARGPNSAPPRQP